MPLDVTKTRLQLQSSAPAATAGSSGASSAPYKGMLDAGRRIIAEEGAAALWSGIAPALVRQATYGSARIGMYEPIKEAISSVVAPSDASGVASNRSSTVLEKLLAGTLSGAIASGLFNPTDRVKVMLQAKAGEAGKLAAGGAAAVVRHVLRTEGVAGFYRGFGPTATRAALVASSELASYDEFKSFLTSDAVGLRADSTVTHLMASGMAGFVATIVSSPADVIKSRVMAEPARYPTLMKAVSRTVAEDGILALYKGFWPNATRIVPHVCIAFMVIERMRYWFGVSSE
jgi:hypothetical protein